MLNQLGNHNPSSTLASRCSMGQLGNIHIINVSKDCFTNKLDH